MGWTKSKLNTVVKKTISPSNFYWIGARDLDLGEVAMANEHNLHVFSSDEVKSRGMAAVMRNVLNCIASNNNDNIHVSIDIDAMDPSLVCAQAH